ncbi:MAG: carbohydrate binding domain-containing protein [Parcubacteria group bacterium]|nr:carbohydrate binding domain-containing protein [Parcubacteria group bacterium]
MARFTKILLAFFAAAILLSQPLVVLAQMAVSGGGEAGAGLVIANDNKDKAKEEAEQSILEALENAAAVAFKNGLTFFLSKIAEDTAKWIASGDKGQKPLFITEGWGDYLQNVGESAIAETVITFADQVGLGNICVSPEIAIAIALPSLDVGVKGPRCSLDDLKKAWDVTDPAFLEKFTLSFNTQQNDLGVAVNFLNNLEIFQAKKEEAAKNERTESAFKAVQDGITGVIETPTFLVEQLGMAAYGNNALTDEFLMYTGQPIADAVGVFTNTLISQYMKKLQSGFFSLADVAKSRSLSSARNSLLNSLATGGTGSDAANANFTNVFRPNLRQNDILDLLTEFTACPAEVKYSGLYNCVMDAGFAQAVSPNSQGSHLTVRDAVDAGLLHGDWDFGFTDPVSGTEPSYLNGYAYSNMKKLRRARVIPVGWELAALKVRQNPQGGRVSLQQMLDAFDDDGLAGRSLSPYAFLVDPDWVLKLPEMRCTARGPGQILVPNSSARSNTCVDVQDCVVKGKDGQCAAWGYCTNEKRAWVFPAESCAPQFATCDQYTEKGEDSADNVWLGNTLEYKGCTAQTAGCLWYSLAKNAVGEWREDDRVYLNSNAKECDADDASCRRYIRMVSGSNLLRNSSFEDDGGHNYVLGAGDQTADNGTPDGWAGRAVTTALVQTNVLKGAKAVSLVRTGTAGTCLPGLTYTAPLGSFEVGQQYTISGQVHSSSTVARSIQLSFQGIPFTVQGVAADWQPFSFTFVMPATATTYTFVLGANNGTCGDLSTNETIFYDAVQLEKGVAASTWRDYGTANLVNLKKAPACTFEDVGCQTYKPVSDKSSSAVNGVATGANLCPAECENYDSYEQQSTATEPAMFANFIPSTAKTCTAEHVGCQEFTNLDEVAAGGEGREYYSEIRHCETPQPQCNTFYAWEGSDQTGFQLMTLNLLASLANGSGAPKTTDGSVTCDPADVNCRELIAQDGSRSVRDLSKTITCSDACAPLRGTANTVNQAQCESRLGKWDATTLRCVYQVLATESRACPATFAGCREYVGNTGRNVAVIFSDNFEDGDTAGWSAGTISTESTVVGGRSMKLGGRPTLVNVTTQVPVQNVVPGKGYELQLSAKASVSDFMNVNVWLGSSKADGRRLGGFVTGTAQWNQYKVGPFTMPANATGPYNLIIEFSGNSAKPDELSLFLDNIVLRQLKNSSFLVKNSWITPNTCEIDPPLAGGTAGRSMLGCKAYTVSGDAASNKQYLTGFARLCSAEKIGCEALIDTQNSTAAYRETFQMSDEAERVVPEDQVRFVVNRKEFICQPDQVGCTELGKPKFSQAGDISGYESAFLINNPDTYLQTLCKAEGLFCKEFTTSSGSIVYAKHPGLQQCEYREVKNSFPKRFGWFKVGDTGDNAEENPVDCLDADKNTFVNRCPLNQATCTQFLEPITNLSYFYKKNSLLSNAGECNGGVNWKEGCVVFDDVSVREKKFKSGTDIDFIGTPDGCQTNPNTGAADVGCNTNTLLRVNLDRSCTQWVTGVSTSRFYDRNLSQFRTTSYGLGRCLEADPINPSICRKWNNDPQKPALTEDLYKDRDTSWGGEDYAGYSIPNQFPVETLRQRSLDTDDDGNPSNFRLTRLTEPLGACRTNADCGQEGSGRVCRLSLDGTTGLFEGQCYIEEGIDAAGTSVGEECRAYPEDDSPFPSRLATFAPMTDEKNPGQIISKDQIFKQANIGHDGEDVECSYNKVSYGSVERYYALETIPPSRIKLQGNVEEYKRKDTFLGWEGYCLERDPSRLINGSNREQACLTWYPVDVIQGTTDLNNTNLNAGYVAQLNREYYCIEATVAEYRAPANFCGGCPPGYRDTGGRSVGDCPADAKTRLDPVLLLNLANYSMPAVGLGITIFEATKGNKLWEKKEHRWACEPIGGEGWYEHDYQDISWERTVEQIGLMCSKVARIQSADNKNRAWTTRILGKTFPGDKEFIVDQLGWAVNQQNAPYGAARIEAPRLEDLDQPLIVKSLHDFIETCQQCKRDDGMPFGICEDEDPDKNGKYCGLSPNAGSPYALLSRANTSLINQTMPNPKGTINAPVVSIRRDNLPVDAIVDGEVVDQPYPASEDYRAGVDRLQELFAKSYGVWEWKAAPSICVGTCQGGLYEGNYCESDATCGNPDGTIYSCVGEPVTETSGTCVGGAKHNQTCTTTDDCLVPRTDQLHECKVVTGPNEDPVNPRFVCGSGPWSGTSCRGPEDCREEIADGICSFEKRCQATVNGQVVLGANSGELCSRPSDCNDTGICGVNRCSSDPFDTVTNICAGKVAGSTCGPNTNGTVNKYVQLGPNEGAAGWDLVADNPAATVTPIVRPTISDPRSPNGLTEGQSTGFSINGQTDGVVGAQGGRAPVTLSFYAYNDNGQQMPLRLILVDWNDGSDPAESRGAFKNHKHVCKHECSNKPGQACSENNDCRFDPGSKATCDPFNFGDMDDACVSDSATGNGYFTFSYTYTCTHADPADRTPCTFKPTVLVRDNWGATTRVTFPGTIEVLP